ncbi:EAL domain-containing protein [Pseudomonas capeferrum]|uniref:bifunctional diguanylate cyclase/phosphodiesterase n=1 Tax=Pseudomonas capeferrum TaxID=1495066 RepID=UPI0015E4317D|nr:EAL domain-containing protein [Pseudomonas capeferrum]MBA1205152.1 EAL domain-containing protein [Pseudomonas capeferrum]
MDASLGNGTSTRSHVVRQLIVGFAGLLALALVIGAVSLYRIAGTLNEREVRASHFYADSALTQLERSEKVYLLSHAVWQSAYDHLVGRIDQRWAFDEDNVGPTLFTSDGYEGVYVLDDSGTRYAIFEGQLSDVPLERRTGHASTILQRAREASQASESEQAAVGFLLFDGQPALFTAAVIQPLAMPHHLAASQTVLVFIRALDPVMLKDLGATVGLHGFATTAVQSPAKGRGYIPLPGSGRALTWTIPQPGSELLWSVGPPLAAAALIILTLMAVFARYAMRVSTSIDRSHQRLAESKAALQTSEERFKAVAEAASDWIWESDAQLRLTYLSPRFAELTGYPVEQWLLRPLTDLLECDTQRVETWLGSLAASGAAGSLRCHYRDQLGQSRTCRISARAIIEHKLCVGFRGTSTDITDEVAAHAQIQHLSMHDALTGLPNRNKLFRFLEEAGHTEMAVLVLDLDNFKPINDSLGHPAGDAVLMEVAARLGQATRDSDLVARLGGDEFVLALVKPGQREELDRFCARIIQSLQQPIQIENHRVHVGASLGVVLSREHGGGPSELIRYADVALYSAKQAGKNTWRYFSTQMSAALLDKRALERELREGIPRGELVLHFQPRFCVDGTTVASVEALVRWQHPERGLMRPDDFIGLAEESDLIVHLGNWVLHEACLRASGWPLEVMVSVNMSPAQFSLSDVVRDVREALIATRLPAHRLELEITENVMLNDVEGALHTMNALKELGVRLNMDDFGTGYSSLGYLRTYPFDSIKIDKRFVQSLGRSDSDRSVVQAIINLGNAMGMTVTAEGVETADQLALLSADQCHEVQGFLLSRPIDNDDLIRLMNGYRAPEPQECPARIEQ